MDLQVELAQAFDGDEHHLVNQRPDGVAGVFAVDLVHGAAQLLGHAAVGFGDARMQGEHRRLCGFGQESFELDAPGLERGAPCLELFDLHGSVHAHDLRALELPGDLRQLLLHRRTRLEGLMLTGGGVGLGRLDGCGDGFGGQELGGDAVQDPGLDRLGRDDLGVLAGPTLARGAAGEFLTVQGHPGAAQRTLHQAREQALGLATKLSGLFADRLLPILNSRPECVVEEPQFGNRFTKPVGLWIEPA